MASRRASTVRPAALRRRALSFGEGELDRVVVGAVGRQEQEFGAGV